ncbi:YrzI family small protein [Bacillus canaveralius]|uniref:YrzI family small protein n=1 Tax=Bacillus canaveralius TaxID=1403243 RepID=UPI002899C8A1|nr:YrzI family small protein [Bacillus canaveralius]
MPQGELCPAAFLCLLTVKKPQSLYLSCGFFARLDRIKEVKITMTLNILFLTITIKRRKLSPEQMVQEEMVKDLMEKNKDRQYSMYRTF